MSLAAPLFLILLQDSLSLLKRCKITQRLLLKDHPRLIPLSLTWQQPLQERLLFHAKKPSIAIVNVKIVKAKIKHNLSAKAEFTFIAKIFVGVTDATGHVDLKLTRKWGQRHDLVTNNGLLIVDCSGTHVI